MCMCVYIYIYMHTCICLIIYIPLIQIIICIHFRSVGTVPHYDEYLMNNVHIIYYGTNFNFNK